LNRSRGDDFLGPPQQVEKAAHIERSNPGIAPSDRARPAESSFRFNETTRG